METGWQESGSREAQRQGEQGFLLEAFLDGSTRARAGEELFVSLLHAGHLAGGQQACGQPGARAAGRFAGKPTLKPHTV